jgi:hypothetical protein
VFCTAEVVSAFKGNSTPRQGTPGANCQGLLALLPPTHRYKRKYQYKDTSRKIGRPISHDVFHPSHMLCYENNTMRIQAVRKIAAPTHCVRYWYQYCTIRRPQCPFLQTDRLHNNIIQPSNQIQQLKLES